MPFRFNIEYRSSFSSLTINEKLYEVWGRNGVLTGFQISKHAPMVVAVGPGRATVHGALAEYIEDNPGNPLSVTIPNTSYPIYYIYALYSHENKTMIIKCTPTKTEAFGDFKVFLGHANMNASGITSVQVIEQDLSSSVDPEYKRMPNMNEIINYFYLESSAIEGSMDDILKRIIGTLTSLRTSTKSSIVGAINSLVDDKEPTLTRDRILTLLGGGQAGNIDIGSINGIPVSEFVRSGRQVLTPSGSGLAGGGNLASDVSLRVDFGTSANQAARGNHTHGNLLANSGYSSHKVLVTDANGAVTTTSSTTVADIEFISGSRSNIQSQIDTNKSSIDRIVAQLGADLSSVLSGLSNQGNRLGNVDSSLQTVANMLAQLRNQHAIDMVELRQKDIDLQNEINSKAADGKFLPLTGGTMTGSINMSNNAGMAFSGSSELSVNNFKLNGNKFTISRNEPAQKENGLVWIQLP